MEKIDHGEVQRFAQEMAIDIEDIKTHADQESRWNRMCSRFVPQRALSKPRKASVPLIQRWWIPYACASAIALIWVPDHSKVKFLYWADAKHENVKMAIHRQYWRMTMPPAQYAMLMEQLEANVPKTERVQSPDCPF